MPKLPKRQLEIFVFVIFAGIVLTYCLVKTSSMLYHPLGTVWTENRQLKRPLDNMLAASGCTTDQNFMIPTMSPAAVQMEERVKRISEKCEVLTKTEYMKKLTPTGNVWSHFPLRLSYCITPKVGCTGWKRFMRFIAFDYPEKENIAKPSDIDRGFVHYGQISNIRQSMARNTTLFANDRLFMFARDPFSRLWSAYIDKIYLPDFWRTTAHEIVSDVRQNISEFQMKCPNNLTFEEFLTSVSKRGRVESFNEHWEPSHRVCSPCHANYEFIGKQETFARDSNLILSSFGFQHFISNESSLERARSEIEMLVTYNLDLENAYNKTCFKRIDVAERLWRTFQLNGYISIKRKFPQQELMAANFTVMKNPLQKEIFIKILYQILEKQTPEEWRTIKLQKRQLMIEEYKKVPMNIIKAIQDIYMFDFSLFEYDPCPRDMFEICPTDDTLT